jgi:hypothetical protein
MPVLCLEYACFIVISNSWLPMNEIFQHCLSLTLGLRIHRGGDRWMSEYWTRMTYPQELTDCHWGSTIVWIVDTGDESWYNYLSKGSGWHPRLLMHGWVWCELCWYLEVRWYWQENLSSETKSCAIATLSTTNSILTALGTNPALCLKWVVTACTIAWLANG